MLLATPLVARVASFCSTMRLTESKIGCTEAQNVSNAGLSPVGIPRVLANPDHSIPLGWSRNGYPQGAGRPCQLLNFLQVYILLTTGTFRVTLYNVKITITN
jgi:hypothetical protein